MKPLNPLIEFAYTFNTFAGVVCKHLLIFFFLLTALELAAQPSINSVNGTTSRCIKTGSLTVSATGGSGTLQYALITPSKETRPNQTSNVFLALAPGNYTILVVDTIGRTDTTTFTISGNYVVPTYSYSTTATTCSKSNGKFSVKIDAGGRSPYKYKIVSGPSTTSWQSSNSFTGLASGSYTVAISDSCDNTKNVSVTITDSVHYALQTGSDSFKRISGVCDSFDMRFFGYYGIGSLKYRIIYGTDTLRFSKNQVVRLELGKNYKYEVEDACGTIVKKEIKYVKTLSLPLILTCNDLLVRINPYYYNFLAQSTCYKYGLVNTSTSKAVWQRSNVFNVQENVKYDLYAVDTCCNDTFTREETFTRNKRLLYQKDLATNLDSTTGIRILNYSTSYPYYTILLKSPFTSTDSFSTTPDQDRQGKYPYNFQDGDTLGLYNGEISDLSNVPKGKYTFVVVDTCGNSDTLEVDVLESDLWKKEIRYTVETNCPSGHSIPFSITNTSKRKPRTRLYQLSPNTSIKDISTSINDSILYDTMKSLNAGTYLIEMLNYWGGPYMTGGGTETISDTIVVKDPGYPLLSPPITYTCRNGSTSIITSASGGSKPYRYRIQKTGDTTWSSYQSSGEFHNLTTGTYRIEVKDTCNNTNVISASGGYLTAPNLKLGFICDADTLTLFGNDIYGVKYRWYKGTTQISTELSHSFKPYTSSDYGTYKLQAYINNSNGVCVDTSASITIGPTIEVRNKDVYACDSFKYKTKWITKTGFIKDTLQSVGGCDSVALTKVFIGHKVFQTIDSSNCDSSFLFGNWYYQSQSVYNTTLGRGYHVDSLHFSGFETSPSGWTFNNCAISAGGAHSGTKKVTFDSPNDWIELPSMNFPDQLNFDYKLDSLGYGSHRVKVQYYNGSVWIDVEEKELSSSIYERHTFDLSIIQDSLNVRLRIKQSSQATNASCFIDNLLVTNTSVECDTIIKVNLSINKSFKKDEFRVECDSALIHGNWYYSTQQVRDTLVTAQGCDSIITTHLTINPTKFTTVNTTVCDSGMVNGAMYYTTQLVKDSFTTHLNCDSIIHTYLTVNRVKRIYLNQTNCDSGLVHGKWYYTSQIIQDTFSTHLNCDSIVITDLTINYSKITRVNITNCDSALIHGSWYYATQEVRDTLATSQGCDSVIVTNLTINPTKLTIVYATVCDSGIVNGTMYYTTQLVKDSFFTDLNCDSIVHTHLTVNRVKRTYLIQTNCDSGLVHGKWYYTNQIIQDTFRTSLNCDSIVITDLTINYTKVKHIDITSCDSALILGNWYFTTQLVSDTLVTSRGCDSVVITNLTIDSSQRTNRKMSVCDSVFIKNNWYFTSQIVYDSLQTRQGCDSIVTIEIEVKKSFFTTYTDTFCRFYAYELNDGRLVNQPGVYRSIYSTNQNCDSIFEVHLIEKDCSPCTVFFPNAFTPNSDNLNEGFSWKGTCTFNKYQLSIYNRWGEKLFYTEDPNGKWSGMYMGSMVQQGVYLFTCYYITTEGLVKHVKGTVTVLY